MDIVKRLRDLHDRMNCRVLPDGHFKTLWDRDTDCQIALKDAWDAAEEIERLRAENESMKHAIRKVLIAFGIPGDMYRGVSND